MKHELIAFKAYLCRHYVKLDCPREMEIALHDFDMPKAKQVLLMYCDMYGINALIDKLK